MDKDDAEKDLPSGSQAPSSGAAAGENQAGNGAETLRNSRRLLSSVEAVPEWLKQRYPISSEHTTVHVVHVTQTLPHFQVRLGAGKRFNGQNLGFKNRFFVYYC